MKGDFSDEARSFIMAMVKQKEFIHRHGYREHNTGKVMDACRNLRLLLASNTYTDAEMAQFFIAHQSEIRLSMPSILHSAWQKANGGYNQLLARARAMVQPVTPATMPQPVKRIVELLLF